jgi:hypothetical protein
MTVNMGLIDRVLRAVVAAVLIGIVYSGMVVGTLGIVLYAVAGVMLLTAAVGFCPAYMPIGFSTKK